MNKELKKLFEEIKIKKNCKNCSIYKQDRDCLFQFYNLDIKPKSRIMIIMQNPGEEENRKSDLKKFLKDDNAIKFVETCQECFEGYQKSFFKEFFNILEEKPCKRFDVFYITDAIKCESKKISYKNINEKPGRCCFNYLQREIDLVKPELIITFGNESFNALYEKYNLEPINPVIDNKYCKSNHLPITKVHGCLFNEGSFYVLPLVHLSNRNRNLGKKRYFEDFKQGLEEYHKLK